MFNKYERSGLHKAPQKQMKQWVNIQKIIKVEFYKRKPIQKRKENFRKRFSAISRKLKRTINLYIK